jgi:hypothetical protein
MKSLHDYTEQRTKKVERNKEERCTETMMEKERGKKNEKYGKKRTERNKRKEHPTIRDVFVSADSFVIVRS